MSELQGWLVDIQHKNKAISGTSSWVEI